LSDGMLRPLIHIMLTNMCCVSFQAPYLVRPQNNFPSFFVQLNAIHVGLQFSCNSRNAVCSVKLEFAWWLFVCNGH
jgi:hypothetical protein